MLMASSEPVGRSRPVGGTLLPMRRAPSRPRPSVGIVVLLVGVLGLAGWWLVHRGEDGRRPSAVPSEEAPNPRAPSSPLDGPDAILGTSWTLIERWSTLNERCSRLHERIKTAGEASTSELAIAAEATWDDLKAAYDAVMKVASTLEGADAGARAGDEAQRRQYVRKARELVERSEALLTRADARLSAVGY